MAASNIVPDLILTGDPTDDYVQEIIQPLDELVEKHNFDLGKVNSSVIDTIRSMDSEGRLLTIPNSNDYVVMYYNKEVFDKFGIDYPTEKMTWEETIALAKQVTGERDGISYRGLELRGGSSFPLDQLSVNLTDPETGAPLLTTEPAAKKYLDLVEEIYSIPGNLPPKESDALGDFIAGNVAMALASPQFMRWGIQTIDKAEPVDFAPAPVWSDNPDKTAPAKSYYHWIINKYSEHKDEAFQVLTEYLSTDIQSMLTKEGQEMTVLADDDIKLQFGADLDIYAGKDIEAIFAVEPANPPEKSSKWNKYVTLDINEFIHSEMDTNTYLRIASEKTEIAIKEAEAIK